MSKATNNALAGIYRLAELVGEASVIVDQSKGVSTLHKLADRLVKGAEGMSGEEVAQVMATVDPAILDAWGTLATTARMVAEKLNTSVSIDREEGDRIAAALLSAIQLEAFDTDEQETDAHKWIDAWKAIKPSTSTSGTRGTGGGRKPVPGQAEKVQVTCSAHNWSTTQLGGFSDSLNSVRDQIRRHHGAQHGSKFGKGDTTFANLTAALSKVIKQESSVEETEGYKLQVG